MDKLYVEWKDYLEGRLDKMRRSLPISNNSQVIVGLTRGGLIPAVYLSHAFSLPMITFEPHLLHVDGTEREPIHLPISPPTIKEVLIVDDIADTGKTFMKTTKFFQNKGFKCTTMSVFYNRKKTCFIPDHPGEETNNQWVVFPYEKE